MDTATSENKVNTADAQNEDENLPVFYSPYASNLANYHHTMYKQVCGARSA